jgi:hypothetical protein
MDKEIITAIIAATSALAGVALSQLIALLKAHLDRKHQRQILFRTKYEELANHLNDALAWTNNLLSVKTTDELQAHSQPMSTRRIYALVLLYFPLLKQEAIDYVQASIQFQGAVSEMFSPRIGASAGAQAVKNNEAAIMKASRELNMARQALDNKIEKHASTYISA